MSGFIQELARQDELKKQAIRVVNKACLLYERYAEERRKITQPFNTATLARLLGDFQFRPDEKLVRESLLEHVGVLPMLTTVIFPYIDDPYVDLGNALTMLAVHDIGETVVGDQHSFAKTGNEAEYVAAIGLLHPMYHHMYDQVETQSTPTGQFAKSIDKIAPLFLGYLSPIEQVVSSWEHYTNCGGVEKMTGIINAHERPFMTWNPFMTEVFNYLLADRAKNIRKYLREVGDFEQTKLIGA